MKTCGWILAGLVLAGAAHAQTVAWRVPVLAEIDEGAGAPWSMPFWPLREWMPPPATRLSKAGAAGFVLAGGGVWTWPYPRGGGVTPHVVKVSSRDGRILWRWQPEAGGVPDGYLSQSAIDVAGNVVAAGWQRIDGRTAFLLVKLDGATGAQIWRRDGADSSARAALDVAVDPAGNAFMTAKVFEYRGQFVGKYSAATGALQWSSVLPGGEPEWDDFAVAVDASGDAVAAGAYFDLDYSPPARGGVQVAKFRSSDGAILWSRRFPLVESGHAPGVLNGLRASASGDILLYANGSLYALAGANGATRWEHRGGGDFFFSDLTEDSSGGVLLVGRYGTGYRPVAEVRRLALASGVETWRAQYSVEASGGSVARRIQATPDGKLLLTWNSSPAGTPGRLHAGRLDAQDGRLMWQVEFGGSDPFGDNGAVDIEQGPDGSVFVSAYTDEASQDVTWTLYKLTGSFADDIFANGYDR